MNEILILATIITPLTTAMVEVVKKTLKLNVRFLPLIAIVLGVILGGLANFLDADLVLRLWAGGVSGLASVGLFELGKNSKKENKHE